MTGTSQQQPEPEPEQQQPAQVTLPLPVDRDWIKNLILKSNNPNKLNNGQALVVAPMVDQSDYPFRLLTRRYGANLTYTPMMNSGLLVRSAAYQANFLPRLRCNVDRPVIAQLAGHEPHLLEQAAKLLMPYVDGIDLNCGCPQGIAKRGFYGAFLLEDEAVLMDCVTHLVATIPLPVTVKVRLLPDDNETLDKSMALYTKLVDAGIHLLTVHGRTRHQLHVHTGSADWDAIRQVVDRFGDRIPIFANGGIGNMADVAACFEATQADGVMSSEAILEYPALFAGDDSRLGRVRLAREYLVLAQKYPVRDGNQGSGIKCLKAHVHKLLHTDLEAPEGSDHALRQRVACSTEWQELWDIVDFVESKQTADEEHKVEEEQLGWYMRHRIEVVDASGRPMSACELKIMRDSGQLAASIVSGDVVNTTARPEVEDPDKAAAYTFFAGQGAEDGGDY